MLILLAEELDEGHCHALGCAGPVEDLAHHNAEAYDDTNRAQGAAEAAGNGAGDLGRIHSADQANGDRRDDQAEEGMYLRFQNKHDQNNNADKQRDNHLSS